MILVDTSVWIDHFRKRDDRLSDLLEAVSVLTHPFVIGELALGSLARRDVVLDAMRGLPMAQSATPQEVEILIERESLFGRGIGYVDTHLLAAARLQPGTAIWTRDRRLHEAAGRLGLTPRFV